ncbi:MAG: hypothetical protein ABSD97_07380 [Acidimicrobiales bacterium]
MSPSDYIVDVLLVLLVLRQIRPRALTPRSVLLPAVLLAFAASQYLKAFPTAGNDVLMDVILIIAGAVFGVVSGLWTQVWNDPSRGILCRAGAVAATAWVLGMGIRLAFDIWAHTSSGGATLFRFSVRHSITSGDAYATAFVLMAFAQVLIRVGILQYRRIRLSAVASPPVGELA